MLKQCCSNDTMHPCCGFCQHAVNRREWDDKIDYGNGAYDIIYCEEITCKMNGMKHHPSQFGCNGKYFEAKGIIGEWKGAPK